MSDNKINEVKALEQIDEIVLSINEELNTEGYKINKQNNRYVLISEDTDLEFLDEGGFADVYKSLSTGLIVKKLKDEFKNIHGVRHRFHREFKLTKELADILGIIKVYEFDQSNYSYTMEMAEATLEEYMRNEHNDSSKITIIRQILAIMLEVHDRNIIHRDLSPNNVLLFNGQLKISDFGLGKDLDMFHSHRTLKSHAIGQYHYCAPEQFMQLKDGDKKSDVYSLGSLINFIMTNDPRDNKHFLKNPVEKAKNQNPNLRYEDARALLQSIEKTIKNYQDPEYRELVLSKIKQNTYDQDVENFISNLSALELCKAILNYSNMVALTFNFIKLDDQRAVETIRMIEENYQSVCTKWTDYDRFGELTYGIIQNNLTYTAQEISTRILYDIAYNQNRFHVQSLVNNLLDRGIDPTLEDMLHR